MRQFFKTLFIKWLGLNNEHIEIEDRIKKAIYIRKNSVNDFFGGWNESDLELLKNYQQVDNVTTQPGEIVDWIGVKTDAKMHAWLNMPENRLTISSLPVPDDQIHAETIEYIALVVALERALIHGKQKFTALELGASYAPWVIAAGVLSQRAQFNEINLLAVEANRDMASKILEHAGRNNLLQQENTKVEAIHGAIYLKDESVYFPKVDVKDDNGAQIRLNNNEGKDYRGLKLEHDVVKGYSLKTLTANYSRIDLLHMDVQGAEQMLLNDKEFLETLDKRVATLFLATQSRLIEGIALKNLAGMGWQLLRERPTMYLQNSRTQDINGWTLRDGGQLWINPNFGTTSVVQVESI